MEDLFKSMSKNSHYLQISLTDNLPDYKTKVFN